jgi:hypothetical protein
MSANTKKTKTLVPGGHEFEIDEDDCAENGIKYYDSSDYHGGPFCRLCYKAACQHCDPEFLTESCPAKELETLPGLAYD